MKTIFFFITEIRNNIVDSSQFQIYTLGKGAYYDGNYRTTHITYIGCRKRRFLYLWLFRMKCVRYFDPCMSMSIAQRTGVLQERIVKKKKDRDLSLGTHTGLSPLTHKTKIMNKTFFFIFWHLKRLILLLNIYETILTDTFLVL